MSSEPPWLLSFESHTMQVLTSSSSLFLSLTFILSSIHSTSSLVWNALRVDFQDKTLKDNAKQSNPVDMNDAAEALTFSSAGLSGRAGPGQEGPAGGGQEGERWLWMMRRAAGPSGWELAAAGRVSSSGTVVPQVPAAPEVAPWCCTTKSSSAHHDGADQWDEPAPLTWVSMSARMKVGDAFFQFLDIWSKFVCRKHFVLSTYELGVSDSQFSVHAV